MKPKILDFAVKIYNEPLLMIGEDVNESPIFVKYSALPEVAEDTIKKPFNVVA